MLVEDSSGYRGIAPVWRCPALLPLRTQGSGGTCIKSNQRCCWPMLAARQPCWKSLPLFCDTNRQSMELAGVASGSPRKFIAWMADHPSGPRIFQAASRPTSAEPSPPCPQTGPGERGQRGQRRGIQRGLGRCTCSMLQICPCWPLIAHRPLLGMLKYTYGSPAARG